jgi:hypothetical protein
VVNVGDNRNIPDFFNIHKWPILVVFLN